MPYAVLRSSSSSSIFNATFTAPCWWIWDGAAIHRSNLVRQYIADLKGKVWVERLPPYAPEINPVEYLWAYWKQRELPNLCTRDLWQLSGWAAHGLCRIRRKNPASSRLLETGRTLPLMSLYYAMLNNDVSIEVNRDHLARRGRRCVIP